MASRSAESASPAHDSQYAVKDGALDDSYYILDPSEQAFLSSQTGIGDPEELKKHVLQVQKKVYLVRPL